MRDSWPSRPGQPQYEWEEPRVVADNNIRSSNTRLESESGKKEIAELGANSNKEGKGQAQSRLGRAASRDTSTLDTTIGEQNENMPKVQKPNAKKAIQRTVGGQRSISETKVLQPNLLSQEQNASESEHRNTQKTSSQDRSSNMQQVWKCEECPKASSKQRQRQNRNIVSALPCGLAHCNGNMGQEENSMRVDRLRLLGNGVVPQQAEKAFRELMKLFEANDARE